MMKRMLISAALLAIMLALPTAARAQSAFAGVVKDATGAVLPGVTVEAASPALIEQVRTATTDASGSYKIENLRPGVYTITFTLPGFSTVLHRPRPGRGADVPPDGRDDHQRPAG